VPGWLSSYLTSVFAWIGAIMSGHSAATLPPPTPPPAAVISSSTMAPSPEPIALATDTPAPSATPVAIDSPVVIAYSYSTPTPAASATPAASDTAAPQYALPIAPIASPSWLAPTGAPSFNPAPTPSVTPDPPVALQGTPWPAFPSSPLLVPVTNPVVVGNSAALLSRVTGGGIMPFRAAVQGMPPTNTVWSHPIYFAKSTDPVYTIHCVDYGGACPISGKQVHIPVFALPENTADGHLGVVDAGIEYDMWASDKPSGNGGTLNVGWGGYGPVNGNGLGMAGVASGICQSCGLVRPDEVLHGVIPHGFLLVVPCENGHISPATGDDNQPQAGCPPLGTKVWLSTPLSTIASSSASTTSKIIATAMATYPSIIGEKCVDCSLNFVALNSFTYTQPGFQNLWDYIDGGSANGNGVGYWSMSGINVGDLRIIQ
jgi:hypothetical protein